MYVALEPSTDLRVSDITSVRAPARCADGNGTLTPLFFSDDVIDIARAKAICAKCARTATCLQDALDRAEPWGVWGGELLDNGRIVEVGTHDQLLAADGAYSRLYHAQSKAAQEAAAGI